MVIGKCIDVFRGFFFGLVGWGVEERVYVGEFSMEEFVMGNENFHEGAQDFQAFKKVKK